MEDENKKILYENTIKYSLAEENGKLEILFGNDVELNEYDKYFFYLITESFLYKVYNSISKEKNVDKETKKIFLDKLQLTGMNLKTFSLIVEKGIFDQNSIMDEINDILNVKNDKNKE